MEHISDQLQTIKLKVKHLLEENAQLKQQVKQQDIYTQNLVDELNTLKAQLSETTSAQKAFSLLHDLAPTDGKLDQLDEQFKYYIKQLNKSIELLSTTKTQK
jgi:predicted RNase H-like nuclease (RuvC/YqgF family)